MKNLTTYQKNKIRRLYAEGMTRADIARKLKRSWYAVTTTLFPEKKSRGKYKRWADKTPEEKELSNKRRDKWIKDNYKKNLRLTRAATRRYRKRKKQKLLQENKKLVIELGKQLGLYETH